MQVNSADPTRRIADVAVTLRGTHPHAPAFDVLDLVFSGADPLTLIFSTDTVAPRSPFGQLIAAGLDQAMTTAEWFAWTGPQADPKLSAALTGIWSTYVLPRFAARYGCRIG